jgi:hypothetical protein
MPLLTTMPVALTAAFAGDPTKKTQWSGVVRKVGVRDVDISPKRSRRGRAFVEARSRARQRMDPLRLVVASRRAWGEITPRPAS